MLPPKTNYYKLGRDEARENRYPLYSVLVIAQRFNDAREYAAGWQAVTKAQLSTWFDHSADR